MLQVLKDGGLPQRGLALGLGQAAQVDLLYDHSLHCLVQREQRRSEAALADRLELLQIGERA